MAQHPHPHPHRELKVIDAPLDAASQSLADALRASFRVLKLIMLVLVVLFLLTGVQFIDDREEAVVLQFGRFKDAREGVVRTRRPGLSLAWPYPIDETLRVPVQQDNKILVADHFLSLNESEQGRPLGELSRPTLDPVEDGAVLTSDGGLAHVKWRLTYRIDDLVDFVRKVADGGTADAEALITAILDNETIHEAGELTAGEITRHQATEMASKVKKRVNQRLSELGTGITLIALEPTTSVPIPTLRAFDAVSSAENRKQKLIREAQQERSTILNQCAGEAYSRILRALDARESAKATGDSESAARHLGELDRLIEFEAGGEARAAVSQAKSYYTEAVQGIQADQEEYHALLEEYLRAPDLLFARLWTQTKERIFASKEVHKFHVPEGVDEVRVMIGPDPKQRLIDEMEEIRARAQRGGRSRP